MHILHRLNDTLLKVATWGTIFFMGVMAIVIPYEVFGRYVIGKMSTWSAEVSMYSLVWATMLGAAPSLKKGYHVGMLTVIEMVPSRIARVIQGMGLLFMLVFFGLMINFTAVQAMLNFAQLSPASGIPMFYPYVAIPIGFFLMLLVTVEDFLALLGLGRRKEGTE